MTHSLRTDTYTYKIQRLYKDLGMSGEARTESNNLMTIFSDRLIRVANQLSLTDDSKTLGTKDLEYALKIWLVKTPQFAQDLCTYAYMAVEKFYTPIDASKTSDGENAKPIPKSNRAGITMPVTRLEHHLRHITLRNNVSEKASVFYAALLDKVCQEICASAGAKAVEESKQRVTHKHISCAIRHNHNLNYIFNGVVLGGGIDSFIPCVGS